ncbi:MAG: Cna B-type domain-containing protein, partial [Lachnospiraceae bacterium]|nr:Cna B-type domain-containing protein [Lachnospiraceae bacterium]
MKTLFWKRLVAGLGTAAMLLTNVADIMPAVAYAAEADGEVVEEIVTDDATDAETPDDPELEPEGEELQEGEEAPAEEPQDEDPAEEGEETVVYGTAVFDGRPIRGYEEITLDPAGQDSFRDLAPSIGGYAFAGAELDDGTVVTDLVAEDNGSFTIYSCITENGGTVALSGETCITLDYEKLVHITASVIDSFKNPIDEKFTDIELPKFDDELILNDPDNAPYDKVRSKTGSIGLISTYSPDYDFVQATVYGEMITSIIKEEIENTGDYVYYYTLDNGDRVKFLEDATVYMEYSGADSVDASYSYADSELQLRAELEDPAAVPDDAALTVTRVEADTAGYSYGAYMDALTASNDALFSSNTILYDVAFLREGWEIEPANGSVKISLTLLQQQLSKGLGAEAGSEIAVNHLTITPEKRKAFTTTAAATGLEAEDIICDQIDTAAAVLGSDKDILEFSVDSLSVIAVSRVDRDAYNQASGNGKAVRLNAAVVNDIHNVLSDNYAALDLPEFTDILVLDDPSKAPVAKVRTVNKKIGLITTWVNYSYVGAFLNGEAIRSLKKTELPEGGCSYSYLPMEGDEWKALEEDATVLFEYAPANVARTSFEYVDNYARVTAVLEKADAIPADAELVVTLLQAGDNGYDEYMEALNRSSDEEYTENNTLLYDIAFMVKDENGNSVEFHPEEGAVRVTIEFLEKQLTSEIEAESAQDIEVTHLMLTDSVKEKADSTLEADFSVKDVKVEPLEAVASVGTKEQVSFTAGDFSVFAIKSGGQKNTWAGSIDVSMSDVNELGGLLNFAVVANTFKSTDHVEGNVRVGSFRIPGSSANLNQDSRVTANNDIQLKVTKEDASGKGGTFSFGVFDGNNKIASFQIKANPTGSLTLDKNNYPAVITALQGGKDLKVYELDKDGKKIESKGTINGTTYSVTYEYTDSQDLEAIDASGRVGSSYLGEFRNSDGGTLSGAAGMNMFNSEMTFVGEKPQMNNNTVYFGNNKDFYINGGKLEYFTYVPTLKADIKQQIKDAEEVVKTLAKGKNGAKKGAGSLSVLNVKSTAGNLKGDLDNANFQSVAVTGMNVDGGDSSEYLLVNIDATGKTSYQFNAVDSFDNKRADGDNGFSNLGSHIIYNIVQQGNGGELVPYTGKITMGAWSAGLLLAPKATVDQSGSFWIGEIIADTVTHGGQEIHQKNIHTVDNKREINVKVTNATSPEMGFEFDLYKRLVYENATDTDVEPEEWPADGFTFKVSKYIVGTDKPDINSGVESTNIPDLESDADAAHFWTGGKDKYGNTYYYAKLDKNTRSIKLRSTSKLTAEYVYNLHPQYTSPDDPAVHYAAYMYRIEEIKPDNAPANITYDNAKPRYTKIFLNVKDRGNGDYYFIEPPIVRTHNTVAVLGCEAVPNQFINKYRPPTGILKVQKFFDYEEIGSTFNNGAASDYWKIRNAMKVKVSRMVDGAAVETIELDNWGDTDYTNAKTVTSSTGAVYTLRNSREQNGIIVIKTIEGLPMGTYVVEETTDGFIFDTTNKIQVSNKYTVEVSYSGEGTVTEGSRSISTVIDSATGKTVRVTNKYKKPIEGILAIHKIVVPDYGSEIVRDDLNSAILSHVQFRVTSLDDGQAFEFQGATPGWGKQVTTLTYKGREIKIHYGPFGNATWMVTGLPVGRYTVEEIADGVTFGPVQNFPDYNRITYYSVSNFENAFMIDNGGGAPNETSGIRSAAQAEDTSLLKNGQAATEDYRPQVIEAKPYKHVKNKNNTELIYLEDAEMIHIANHYSIPVAEFRAEKKLEGREWNNTDSYTFKIEPVSASFQVEGLNYSLTGTQTKQVTVNGEQKSVSIPMPAHDTVTVTKDTPDHIGVFDQVTYKFKGTYNYKIYEVVPEDADKDPEITYSDKVYDVTVTVAQVDEPLIKSYHLQFDEVHKGMMAVVAYDGNAYANIATFTFTNVYEELTEATVKKVWEDHENAAGLRPQSLTVKLLADGQDTGKSVVLSDANNWEDTIGRLPKYTAAKKEIDYTWSEQGLPANYKLTNTGKTGTITTLTNTLKEGGFKVVKKVTSSTTADKNKEYRFTATLKESENGAVVSGTFGGKTFVSGRYSFTLKDDGKTEDFSGIPVGTYFIVEEADYSGQGFATSYSGNIGTVSEDAYPLVTCTNDKSEGTLTIEKNVFNAIADDDKFSFPVKVVLADTTITQEYQAEGAYNKISFTNGVAEFTLKDTEWVKIKGLPDNMGYTVTEELTKMTDGSKFVSVVKGSTGNISSTGAAKVDIENTRKTGELEVSKELISDAAADADKEFDFTVTLSEQLTGTYGDMTFAGGVATFTLKGGESASADGLPIDMLYTVTEASAEGFELTAVTVDGAAKADKKGAGTISLKPSKVVFTNTRDTGDLKISKKLAGALSDADKDDEFEFTVTLSDDTISGTYGDMTFSAGSATVTIEGEGEKTATGLPVGIGYTITEASAEGFTLTGVTGDTGSIKKTLSVAEFINTHDSGDLEVKKTIESSTPNDLTKNFKFTVTLYQDATKSNKAGVAGTYGDMTFTDSAATFTLTNEQTATAEGLPAGIYYVVEEEDQDGFTRSVTTGLTGTIVKNTVKKAAITNTKDEGGLVVSKEVESDLTADHVEKEFTFTVTLADDTVSGTYGGMTFSGGKATFTLKDGESKTATGLADGLGYSVLETDNEGFTTTWFGQTGVIAKGATNQVKAKNVRKTGSLEVSKVLISDRTADANQQFDFTVTLNPAITGTYSSVDFTNGVATFTLTGGESKTIEGLPVGVTYTVTESEAEGFRLTGVTVDGAAKANGDGGIISVEPSQVEFTNTRDTGDLKISKTVLKAVTADDIAKTFNFNIALTGISGTKTYQAEGKYTSVTFNEGAATVELGNEEYVTVKGLPIGISYTITEDSEAGFVMTGKTGDTGSIRTELSEAAFENTRETGELDVHKIVQSSTPEDLENEEFTFTVQLDDTSIAGTYGDMTFAGGKATVVLKHDETAAATDLPAGIGYTVTETHKDGFTCIASTGVTGQIQKDATVTAEFTNKKDEGGLTVSKLVVSDIPADHEIDFNFTVTLDDKTVKGTYGGMTFDGGVATFSLADGESKSAEGLAKGIGYTVTEADSDGFTTTWEGKTGTISDEATRVARATNTRETGDLTVSKELISDRAADADQTFVFHVKVSEQLNKTYSGVEFDGDEATINLKGGESKKIEGLPVGITYKVTEESVPGFALTAKVGDEGTISTTPSTAVLTNTRDTGDLWISKVVFNPLTDDDESVVFHFRVELSDTTINGTYGQITFADGVAEDVEIHHLETKKALGLPTGITYKITERAADGFVLKGAVGDEGSITTEPAKAVFTNTRDTGDLDVTKTVVSDTASDLQVEFNYTVTLDDTSVEGTYGDMTFAGGVARFTLKHGETKQANGLPTGVGYTIVEADKDGFVLTSQSGTTGSINKATVAHAAFTNTAKGGLVVTKSVVSRKPSDSDLDFAFTVTLDDTSINGAYGQMTFVNGKAEFTLKDGEQSLATGIPAGTGFTVEEAHADGFTTAWTGGITAGTIANGGEPQVVEAVNTRETGDLTVSKVLVSDRAADDDYAFNFTVNVPAEINGTFGDMTFTAGEASVALKGGESATATGLPVGITYTVTEAEATGFVLTGVTVNGEAAANGSGGVISTEPSTVVFTNTRETGDLKISKKIANPLVQSDRDQKFTFTIVLSDTGISKAFEAEGAYQSVAFTGGSTTVELRHEEEVTVKGLPTGITYTITEASAPNFRLTGKTGDSGSITRETAVAEFVNTRDLGDLDVTKTVVSSTPADKTDEEFSFTVTMYRDEDHTEVEDTLAGTFTDPTATKGMTFSAGVATFTLKDGERAGAKGLPADLYYVVTETDKEGYTLTAKTGDTGHISATLSTAAFTNTKNEGGLVVSKSVVSDRPSDLTKEWHFQVVLSDTTVNGTYGEMTFTNGKAEFTLVAGEQKLTNGLKAGIGYTVTETEDGKDGITTTWSGDIEDGKIANGGEPKKVAAVNTRDKGDLKLSKVLVSDAAADKNVDFTFDIGLSEAVSGTYGDVTFTSGAAVVTLKGGESAEAKGLPVGITYTITERSATGFKLTGVTVDGQTKANGDGGVISSKASEVVFTNTRETGDLKLSKAVLNPLTDDDKTTKFNF